MLAVHVIAHDDAFQPGGPGGAQAARRIFHRQALGCGQAQALQAQLVAVGGRLAFAIHFTRQHEVEVLQHARGRMADLEMLCIGARHHAHGHMRAQRRKHLPDAGHGQLARLAQPLRKQHGALGAQALDQLDGVPCPSSTCQAP